ncbi:MAG: cupin domain-containing protein [Clostridiales Family XIII bacterium]|nr:cupin domain-containing protein [Clostridiales Family XIII bacterium]
MRKLICEKDVQAFACAGSKTLYYDANTLITAAARDLAEKLEIKLVEGSETQTQSACCSNSSSPASSSCDAGLSEDIIYKALQVLIDKGIIDANTISNVACKDETKPYRYCKDASGLKIVDGGSVQLEYLDTGNPSNDVNFQEVICSKESSVMNAGFLDINSCTFDWPVECDEMYYVIAGPLNIIINGKTYTANAGDVVNLPVGSTVTFSAPGKAKMFYGIKAA